jgi:trimeric autotransporter adhesin
LQARGRDSSRIEDGCLRSSRACPLRIFNLRFIWQAIGQLYSVVLPKSQGNPTMRRLMLVLGLMALLPLISCGNSGNSTPAGSGSGGNGPVVLKSIQVNPSAASIAPGTTQAFTATGNYSNGTTADLTAKAQWACLLPNLATVSSSAPTQGLATGIASGMVLISASSGGVSNNAVLTITGATLSSVALTPVTATIGFENQRQFKATATFSDKSVQDVTNISTWSSSSPFLTSNSGLAIGETLGTNTISATFDGVSATGPANLTVDLSNLVSISLLPSTSSTANHTQVEFAAIGTFNDGSTRDVSSLVTWSSSNPAVADFGSTDNAVRSKAVGATNIVALLGTLSASATLNVTTAQLQSIAVLPANASIAPSTRLAFAAIGAFSDSTTQDLTNQVTWSVSGPSGSSVNLKGVVTAGQSAGSNTVNVSSPAALGSIQGSTALTVTSATLKSASVTPATAFIVPAGSLAYSATGNFSDGSKQDITALTNWLSDSENVATVASSVTTGQGIGRSTITAQPRIGSVSSGTASLVVASPKQISIAITPAKVQIAFHTFTQLTATGTFVDGTTQDLSAMVNWSSSAPNVATVGFQTGIVSGLAPGQATITAALGSVSATAAVTVTNASLTSIMLSPAHPSVASGSSQQFAAAGNFSDGSTQTLLGATWSSSNPTIAVVNGLGLATGTSPGTTTITAALSGVSGTTSLTVQ